MLDEIRLDLAGVGEASQLMLGEDQFAVEANVEDPTASLDQVGSLAELSLNFVRQTGGTRLVVSNHAVFDCDRHIVREYSQSAPTVPRPRPVHNRSPSALV